MQHVDCANKLKRHERRTTKTTLLSPGGQPLPAKAGLEQRLLQRDSRKTATAGEAAEDKLATSQQKMAARQTGVCGQERPLIVSADPEVSTRRRLHPTCWVPLEALHCGALLWSHIWDKVSRDWTNTMAAQAQGGFWEKLPRGTACTWPELKFCVKLVQVGTACTGREWTQEG